MEDLVLERFTKLVPEDQRKQFHDHIVKKLKDAKGKGQAQTCDFKIKAKEISGEPKGLALEIFTFKEDKYNQLLNNLSTDSDFLVTVGLNAVNTESVEKVKALFEQFKPMVDGLIAAHPTPGATCEVKFRSEGTKINVDVSGKTEKTDTTESGLSYQDIFNFRFLVGIEAGFDDFLKEDNGKETVKKVLSAQISFNGVANLVKILSDIYINDLPKFGYVRKDSTKNMLKQMGAYLLPCLISANAEFIYSSQELVEGDGENKVIGGKTPAETVDFARKNSKEMVGSFKPMIESMGLIDVVKGINFDEINITFASPKDKCGVQVSLRLPGSVNLINEYLK